ncbi:MAG: flagellar biosynthesis protein FlgC [Alphaproteobacteria bacterium]|nr:flagellar biosynthesis protein FlgC [Alphaproteobacteria bacterium]MBU0858357.1 flagellar biosynthesis protein FlgC [Alphaproteobacteria bacterium]
MINAIGIALTGLFGASKRTEAAAGNIANMQTTGSLEPGGKPAPYSAVTTAQTSQSTGGVKTDIIPKDPAFVPAYDPDSPFANNDGLVGVPNIDLATEAVNLSLAKTAYSANIAVIKTVDEMQQELLNSFDREV